MATSVMSMIEEFGRQVEESAGPAVRQQVMRGSARATSGLEPTSLWVRGAVERLERLAGEQTAIAVMEACGANCARVNHGLIARAKARRARHASEEAFLAAEADDPEGGTRLEQDGHVLYQTYTPRTYTQNMRCYCALLSDLPPDVALPGTYCHCSKAFVRTFWEEVLERPVTVELLQSAVSGSDVCRFRITPRSTAG
ncbi:MAG: DUF6144 family protein [Gemmatimonadetes bacterium]|nr:DUF6144 family protein [Gemmatimonadota bacterium]